MSSETRDTEKESFGVINVRLASIESTLSDLKDLLVKVPILTNDMADIERRTTSAEANINYLSNDMLRLKESCKEVAEFKGELNSIKDEISVLKVAHIQRKANRWEYIIDYLFKGLVAAACVYLFAKIGISV